MKPILFIAKNDNLNTRISRMIMEKEYDKIKKLVVPTMYEKIQSEIISKEDQFEEEYFIEGNLFAIGITNDDIRKATPEEKVYIENIQKEILKDNDCNNVHELHIKYSYSPYKKRKYFADCNKRYREHNIENFQAYEIDWYDSLRISRIEDNIEMLKKNVNNEFIKHFVEIKERNIVKKTKEKYEKKKSNHIEHGLGKYRDESLEKIKLYKQQLRNFINDFVKI